MGGPSSNPKYYLQIDSEQVPWGKGEKYSEQEGEIEPETVRLQAVGANLLVTACLLHNEPTSYSSLARLILTTVVVEAKASLNRATLVRGGRRETWWSTHGQVEVAVTRNGGPNQ